MKRFFTYCLVVVFACCLALQTSAQVVGTGCPPTTVNTIVVTVAPIGGCPTAPEVQINSVTHYNSYYLYLYAGNTASGTPLRSVEVIGNHCDLIAFGDGALVDNNYYTIKAVPFSTNLGVMSPQYDIISAPIPYHIVQPAANARGAASSNSSLLNCNGIIDVNIVTRTGTPNTAQPPTLLPAQNTPTSTPVIRYSLSNLTTSGFITYGMGDRASESFDKMNTVVVLKDSTSTIWRRNASSPLKKVDFLNDLYWRLRNNKTIRFRYQNNLLGLYKELTMAELLTYYPQSPSRPIEASKEVFLAALNSFLKTNLVPKLPNTNNTPSVTLATTYIEFQVLY